MGEVLFCFAGLWIALFFVFVAILSKSRFVQNFLISIGVVGLLLQGGCCVWFRGFDRALGGSGGGLELPLSVIGAIVFGCGATFSKIKERKEGKMRLFSSFLSVVLFILVTAMSCIPFLFLGWTDLIPYAPTSKQVLVHYAEFALPAFFLLLSVLLFMPARRNNRVIGGSTLSLIYAPLVSGAFYLHCGFVPMTLLIVIPMILFVMGLDNIDTVKRLFVLSVFAPLLVLCIRAMTAS